MRKRSMERIGPQAYPRMEGRKESMMKAALTGIIDKAKAAEEGRRRLADRLNDEGAPLEGDSPHQAQESKDGLLAELRLLPANILRMAVALMYSGRDSHDLKAAYQGLLSWDKETCILKLIQNMPLSPHLLRGLQLAEERGVDLDAGFPE